MTKYIPIMPLSPGLLCIRCTKLTLWNLCHMVRRGSFCFVVLPFWQIRGKLASIECILPKNHCKSIITFDGLSVNDWTKRFWWAIKIDDSLWSNKYFEEKVWIPDFIEQLWFREIEKCFLKWAQNEHYLYWDHSGYSLAGSSTPLYNSVVWQDRGISHWGVLFYQRIQSFYKISSLFLLLHGFSQNSFFSKLTFSISNSKYLKARSL